MRKLITRDVFAFLRVVTEAGVRQEIKAIADKVADQGADVDARSVGFDLMLSCIEHLSAKRAEDLVYEFLAGPLEIPSGEIADMELVELSNTATKWFADYADPKAVKAFFGAVSRLMKDQPGT